MNTQGPVSFVYNEVILPMIRIRAIVCEMGFSPLWATVGSNFLTVVALCIREVRTADELITGQAQGSSLTKMGQT